MKKFTLGLVTALMLGFLPALFSAPAQAASPTVAVAIAGKAGNTVCNSRGSDTRSVFPAYFSNESHKDLYPGGCASNAVGFAVPQGWYCTSPWGYRYNGGMFQVYYPFSTTGNYLVLDCRHA